MTRNEKYKQLIIIWWPLYIGIIDFHSNQEFSLLLSLLMERLSHMTGSSVRQKRTIHTICNDFITYILTSTFSINILHRLLMNIIICAYSLIITFDKKRHNFSLYLLNTFKVFDYFHLFNMPKILNFLKITNTIKYASFYITFPFFFESDAILHSLYIYFFSPNHRWSYNSARQIYL